MKRISVALRDSAGCITLARPAQKNALDRQTADDLKHAIRQFETNESARVIVLGAEGDDFCAGADLHALRGMLDAPFEEHTADARALASVFLALHDATKPTIALVQGRAFAGGAALATACDMIVAKDDAVFSYPEVALGFVPAMAMTLLVRSVGEKVAFDLLTTGRRVTAAEACAMGLASRCFSSETFEAESAAIIAALCRSSATALAATKGLLHRVRDMKFDDAMHEGTMVNARARLTDDFRQGVLRFSRGR